MIPITITADLASAPVITGPLLLDGMLLHAIGAEVGEQSPGGWAALEDVLAQAEESMPLARVKSPYGWWWAASQVTPMGPESRSHRHRRPMFDAALRRGVAGSISHKSGPDKAMRVPQYSRPAMRSLQWTAVGDPGAIGRLLCRVSGVGQATAHGHGWVMGWRVERGGPRVDEYARDVRLRHLPMDAVERVPPRVTRRRLPLLPPYWRRSESVDVWQVPER